MQTNKKEIEICQKPISFEIKVEQLCQNIHQVFQLLKNKIKLILQKKDQDDQIILVQIQGENILNLFDSQEIMNQEKSKQFGQLFNKLSDSMNYSIQSISLHLTQSFLEENFYIQFCNQISEYDMITNIIVEKIPFSNIAILISIDLNQEKVNQNQEQVKQNELIIDIQNDKSIQKENLGLALNILSPVKYLTSIRIYFDWQYIQEKEEIYKIIDISFQQTLLRKFEYFYFGEDPFQNVFQGILDERMCFKNLTHLKLVVGRGNISENEQYQQLGKALEKCQLLKSFKLIIGQTNLSSYEQIFFIVKKAISLNQLQFIEIRLYQTSLVFEEILSILNIIAENKRIISLSFQIEKNSAKFNLELIKRLTLLDLAEQECIYDIYRDKRNK
ncbi:hypothetical protein ABPG72_008246 [Tetrahymena utriculariae]